MSFYMFVIFLLLNMHVSFPCSGGIISTRLDSGLKNERNYSPVIADTTS